jgi:transcriptional regulator GlxA family with amidase domain
MVQLGILVTKQHRLLSVAAMLDVFETANRFYESAGQEPFFSIALLHPGSHPSAYGDYPLYALEAAPQQGLILIPAFASDDPAQAVAANAVCLEWLRGQHRQGAEIASFCSGAFLLAATGLLNGRPATTHIQAATAFAKAFPQVQLQSGRIMTHDCGIYTSGGATNSFHLMLHVLEKYCGPELAVRTAKYFAIDMDRQQQRYFGTFQPVQAHHDELVGALQQRIAKDYCAPVTVEELVAHIPASRRNLARRFKAATGFTPIEYLQHTRVEAARRLLERTDNSIPSVMIDCGYNDLKAFRQVFRKATGMTPTAYREKFCSRPALETA